MSLVPREESNSQDPRDPRAEAEENPEHLFGIEKAVGLGRKAVNIALRTQQEMGTLKGEVSVLRTGQDRLLAHFKLPVQPSVPPAREKLESYSDLDEEITMHGTRVLKGTAEQIGGFVARKVDEVLRQREAEAALETVKKGKALMGKASGKVIIGLLMALAGGVGALIKHLVSLL